MKILNGYSLYLIIASDLFPTSIFYSMVEPKNLCEGFLLYRVFMRLGQGNGSKSSFWPCHLDAFSHELKTAVLGMQDKLCGFASFMTMTFAGCFQGH